VVLALSVFQIDRLASSPGQGGCAIACPIRRRLSLPCISADGFRREGVRVMGTYAVDLGLEGLG
jgi:hypothetical protein